jgi:hypothetical protein
MVGTIPKSNRKIVTRDKIDIPNTQMHDCSLICLGTGTSIKSGGVKLVTRLNDIAMLIFCVESATMLLCI